jgi:phage/plasmid-associated DNA primase
MFTTPELSEAEKEAYKLESNPAKAFVLDQFEAGETKGNPDCIGSAVYQQYKQYCDEGGYKHPLSMIKFNREVRALFPSAELKQERVLGGARGYYWHGIQPKT